MAKIEKFEDLEIWSLAREICQLVEFLIQNTNLKTNYSLRDQIDRSLGSIMDNIAEGFERNGNREFIQFLSIFLVIFMYLYLIIFIFYFQFLLTVGINNNYLNVQENYQTT